MLSKRRTNSSTLDRQPKRGNLQSGDLIEGSQHLTVKARVVRRVTAGLGVSGNWVHGAGIMTAVADPTAKL